MKANLRDIQKFQNRIEQVLDQRPSHTEAVKCIQEQNGDVDQAIQKRLDAKKYQVQVGKKQRRHVEIDEALDKLQQANGSVKQAVKQTLEGL